MVERILLGTSYSYDDINSHRIIKMTDWVERFLDLAEYIAQWSKDPSTKVGAVIVNDLRQIVGHGYNGFPRGVEDDESRYVNRDVKYKMVVHAEINAILNSHDARGCTMYSTFHPCPQCAAAIIQSGIKTVYTRKNDSDDRWANEIELAQQMFYEAEVNIVVLGEEEIPF